MMSSRDNWVRLVVAALKKQQYLELCYKESRSPSLCSFSSDFSQQILNSNSESISLSPEVSRVSDSASARSITGKLLSVWYGRRKAKDKYSVDIPDDIAIHLERIRRFSLQELRDATQNFSSRNIIQQARNNVYKCRLANGPTVAVKRFKYRGGSNQDSEFQSEVVINSITAHPNLLGYCVARKERLLVFRVMDNDQTLLSRLTVKLQEFSWEVLLKVTHNFSMEFKIGRRCTFGSVYHATLDDGKHVAIKRYESSLSPSHHDCDEFLNELQFMSLLNHKNLISLLGYCRNGDERVLVYDYMENGTLFYHLHNPESSPFMSWPNRIKVSLDVARGIEYLHEYAVPHVVHGDINSSNILLDAMWTAKVADFRISLKGPQGDRSYLPTGTLGYVDSEFCGTNLLTCKSDVYSFGVVLLELLSGCEVVHENEDGVQRNLVDHVISYIHRNELDRVLDPRIPPPTPVEGEGVAYMGCLATNCVMQIGRDRPTMTDVVNSLEKALAACYEF